MQALPLWVTRMGQADGTPPIMVTGVKGPARPPTRSLKKILVINLLDLPNPFVSSLMSHRAREDLILGRNF